MLPKTNRRRISRRTFVTRSLQAGALAGLQNPMRFVHAAPTTRLVDVGEGTVAIRPPVGIELAGFRQVKGRERRVAAIRREPVVRALVIGDGDNRVAVVSLDICAVSEKFTQETQRMVASGAGIRAENVRICATHTHSMPIFTRTLQWGAISPKYRSSVQQKVVQAVRMAQEDMAPSEVYLGRQRVVDGNFNRTSSTWRTDDEFDSTSTDDDRWLDTRLHALVFRRAAKKKDLLWYHFSAHPVCFTGVKAGPDWPGIVRERTVQTEKLDPAYLQGHAGDVNPGDGKPWLGNADKVAARVHTALSGAINAGRPIELAQPVVVATHVRLPFDMDRFGDQIAFYRKNPAFCKRGVWVAEDFAAQWSRIAGTWDLGRTHLSAPVTAVRLGEVSMLFHPSELYSFYGLSVVQRSVLEHTLAVGYTDGFVGYLTDSAAYARSEYAALTVPKALGYPPFKATAAQHLTDACVDLLEKAAVRG